MRRKVGIILIILFLVLVAFITNGCSQLSKKQSSVESAFSELVPELTPRYLATKEAVTLMEEVGGSRDVTEQGAQAISRYEKALEEEDVQQLLQSSRDIEVIIGRLNSNAQGSPVLRESEDLNLTLDKINEALPALDVRENYNNAVNEFEDSRGSVQNMFSSIVGGYSAPEKLEFWIPLPEDTQE